jgi:hypothetical protein
MPSWVRQSLDTIGPHLPGIALSIAILIGGWILALIVRAAVFAGLKRTTLDDRIADAFGFENVDNRVERGVARAVYWVALAFVFVAFLERLKVKAVTQPIVALLEGLSGAVPSLLKAFLIGFVGLMAAYVARRVLVAVLDRTGLVDRLEKLSGFEEEEEPKKAKKKKRKKGEEEPATVSQTIGNVVFWLIVVLTAIPVLEALKIGVLAGPLSASLSVISTYLPKVAGAALLAAVGYFLGRMARAVVAAIIDRTGVDRVLSRIGLGGVLGEQTTGSIIGTIVMVFIVLQFAISAVGRLDIREISGPLGLALSQVYTFLPRLLVAGILLALGVAAARIVSRFARGVLAAIGFNTLMAHIGIYELSKDAEAQQEKSKTLLEARLGDEDEGEDEEGDHDEVDPLVAEPDRIQTPADIGGVVIGAIIVILFVRQALETLGLEGMAAMFDSLIGYLPHIGVAAVVLGAGMWAGGWAKERVADLIGKSEDSLFKALPTIVHVAIVAVAAMVALQQLGVANQIIAIAFTLILGAICLALALAFGLGGREVAGRIVAEQYDKRRKR